MRMTGIWHVSNTTKGNATALIDQKERDESGM